MTSIRSLIVAGGALALAAVCWCGASPARAEGEIAVGTGSFEFNPDPRRPDHAITVWTCRPESVGPDSPIVIVMHGTKRNGKTYRDSWAPHSRERDFLLLVPEFPEKEYPGSAYHRGNVVDRDGRPNEPGDWTFTAIERLFDHAKSLTGNRSEKYYLYGHSAGGQFVHRFVTFMPEARYERAVAANPGYYTFPTPDATYPYGLKGTHIRGALGPAVLGRDLVVLLGEDDTDRDDPYLTKTPAADRQGWNRFERGKNYFRTAEGLAREGMTKFGWKLVTVPGVGHSDRNMAGPAARELFAR